MSNEERIFALEKEVAELKRGLEERPTKQEIAPIIVGEFQREVLDRIASIKFVAPNC